MIEVQEMLLQTDDRKIYLLPAWPQEWDVDFKLHAPYKTVLQGKVRHGKLVELEVAPEKRTDDIVSVGLPAPALPKRAP